MTFPHNIDPALRPAVRMAIADRVREQLAAAPRRAKAAAEAWRAWFNDPNEETVAALKAAEAKADAAARDARGAAERGMAQLDSERNADVARESMRDLKARFNSRTT
jgi:hypothetical protein